MWVCDKMDKIEEFVIKEYDAPRTIENYRSVLKKYFKFIKTDPNTYFDGDRNYEEDIENFRKYLMSFAKCTRSSYLNTIKQFIIFNNVELSQKFWKNLNKKKKGNRPVTLDDAPTHQVLQKILRYTDVRSRAFILVGASSGMRINELANIKLNNVDLNNNPVVINIPAELTKTKDSRYTFISDEAKESLLAWLDVRDEFLLKVSNRLKNIRSRKKDCIDERVFGLGDQCIRRFWNIYLEQARENERDTNTMKKFRKYHFHTLRKFFQTYLSTAMEEKFVRLLLGHTGYLGGSYDRYNKEMIGEKYKDAMHTVSVSGSSPTVKEVSEQLKEKDQVITDMQKRIDNLENKYGDLLHELVVKRGEKAEAKN